ncbi:MAG: polysaccharide lyase 6 family protein [Armatimonadota bacterium]|jgi:poly(beta-D-mannuronate) lyase
MGNEERNERPDACQGDTCARKGPVTMMTRVTAILTAALLVCAPCLADVHEVATAEGLAAAVEAAVPGDEIVLADGEWLDAELDLTCSGTAEAPITIRPRTPGGLTLTGASWVRLSGSHLVLLGLRMYGGAREVADDGVERQQSAAPIDIHGDHCRVTECAIIDYNPVGREHRYMWVVIRGVGNRVDHCYFRGQDHSGVTLVVNVERGQPNEALVDHNHFAGKPPLGANGGETIRIGSSYSSVYNSHTTVASNLFENCDGEIEIISNKSCENTYRHNTFRESAGELTLRHGDRCVVDGNFFMCNNYPGARGVRIIGRDHRVVNNYIHEPASYGIVFQEGIVDTALSGYTQVRRALIAFNTIVAAQGDPVWMGRSSQYSEDRPLLPTESFFANNLLVAPGGSVFARVHGPGEIEWAGNIAWGEELGMDERDGIAWTDPMLVEGEGGVLQPGPDSPAVGAAAGGYEYDSPSELNWMLANVTHDIHGRPRDAENADVGCVEVSSEEPIIHRPLSAADVGPRWMR